VFLSILLTAFLVWTKEPADSALWFFAAPFLTILSAVIVLVISKAFKEHD
jgi:hypothetical protein